MLLVKIFPDSKRTRRSLVELPLVFLLAAVLPICAQNPAQREIAITIDDLPAGNANFITGTEILDMTGKLLGTLRDQKVPAIGFVNEKKLYRFGEVDDRIKALSLWLDDGFELGNHTFSHASLNHMPLKQWEEEVIRGETVTSLLLAQHNMKMRYLRHPYLDVGLDLETRRQAETFLTERGYRIAPVTMDAWDWMYAEVYDDARRRGDTALQEQLVTSYFSYTSTVFDYYEKFSKDLIGYEPKQILLLHANWLEADHIGSYWICCESEATASSHWKTRSTMRPTACPINTLAKKERIGWTIGPSRVVIHLEMFRCFRNG